MGGVSSERLSFKTIGGKKEKAQSHMWRSADHLLTDCPAGQLRTHMDIQEKHQLKTSLNKLTRASKHFSQTGEVFQSFHR